MDAMTSPMPSYDPRSRRPAVDAAIAAAQATLRRNTDVSAIFVVAPGRNRSPQGERAPYLAVLRSEPAEPVPAVAPAAFAVPHWALTLLASTEGVR